MRPGTENVPYIVTLGAAAERYGKTIAARLDAARQLNDLLRGELQSGRGLSSTPRQTPLLMC